MFRVKHNDCVHLAYFSFRTVVYYDRSTTTGNVLLTPTVCVSNPRTHCTLRIYLNEQFYLLIQMT